MKKWTPRKRWIYGTLAALCLLMLVVAIFNNDVWPLARVRIGSSCFMIDECEGWLCFTKTIREYDGTGWARSAGLGIQEHSIYWHAKTFAFPFWPILFALLVNAVRMFDFPITGRKGRELARRREGKLCLRCAYDLRASKDRCPECGAKIET